jgi:hypothetical protein
MEVFFSITFLCNQTLPTSGQAHHDDAYPRIFSLHTGTISLSARLYKVARRHFAHLRRKEAVGLRLCHFGCGGESSSASAQKWKKKALRKV